MSVLWNYFNKLENGGKCKLCNAEVKTCGNTTNLKQHLKRKHPYFNLSSISGKSFKSSDTHGHELEVEENIDDPRIVHKSMVIFII